ncbi:uncharacterized protein LOC126992173 [Eriocheir sinensis]|uniref:uncharacterized protein LOC126992173 n=1 Tax=Eriocheir sinensis TaxID=95602 RepID=UPI0021CAC2BC|nr:uncharacterized protein LOC126992173 [Eriocheir sinensis]
MLPSQQQEHLLCDDNPTRPFESVSADFFTAAGKHFLVVVDRLSGWPVVVTCGSDTTSAATIRYFRRLFRDLGVPVRLRTDGGPQFTSRELAEFLERWGVRHNVSSPNYPQSNGHAEAAVKAVKHLILKVAPSGNIDCEAFDKGLLELPFAKEWQARAESCDRRAATRARDAKARYDAHARPLQPLKTGALVRIQDPTTQRWDKVGTVMGAGRSRAYHVRMPSGRILWRNRRFLRPVPPPAVDTPVVDESPPRPDSPHLAVPRRSERLRAKAPAQD